MDMRVVASGLLIAMAAIVVPAMAQDAGQPAKVRYVSLIGTVEKVDAAGKVLEIKPDKADQTPVKFDDKTQFLKIPAGETDTKKAIRSTAGELSVGDRVIARLRAGEETQPAVFMYFSKKTELAERKEKTSEEWKKDGVAGVADSVDPAAKQIVMTVRGAGPAKRVTLDVGLGVLDVTRFSPETGKNEPSTLAAIHPGDQVTVIGQKNADMTAIKVEAITSGFYKTLPVQIKSIDTAAGQILAMDLASKKPITINVGPDTSMKKLDDATAQQLARRLNPTFQNEGRGGRGGRGSGGAEAGGAPVSIPGAVPEGAGGGFQGRGGRGGGRNLDLGRVIDQAPAITLADMKVGEPIVVAGAATDDLSKMRALKLVAGVDPILRAAPQNGVDPLAGNWSLGGGGEGGGTE
jgi:hypothetical protein